MPFLTPSATTPLVSVALACPEAFLPVVMGGIYELGLVQNWEQYGSLTEEEAAQIMANAYATIEVKQGLRQNLRAWWDLTETSGSRADGLGVSTLTDNNTVTYRAAPLGNAAQFSRSATEYLSLADNALFSQGDADLTAVAWVSLDNKTNMQRIMGKWNTTGNQREWLFQYNLTSDRFNFLVSGDGTTSETINAQVLGSPAINTWYMVTCRHNAANDEISVGVGINTPTPIRHTGGIFNGTAPFTLSHPTTGLDGGLYSVGVWDRLLSHEEIVWLYNSGVGRQFTDLASYGG